jgi:hypothetical protein
LCDVDQQRYGTPFQQFNRVRAFWDLRKRLDAMEQDIARVVVATPDHTHAIAASRLLQLFLDLFQQLAIGTTLESGHACFLLEKGVAGVTHHDGFSFEAIDALAQGNQIEFHPLTDPIVIEPTTVKKLAHLRSASLVTP